MPRLPLVTCEELRPAPTSTHVLFLKLTGRGDWRPIVGRRIRLWPLDADEGQNQSTNHRPLDVHSSCTTAPVKAAEQRTPSVLSSMRWRLPRFCCPFPKKNKFVEWDLIRIWWRKFGRKKLYNFSLGFKGFLVSGFGDVFGLSLPAGLAHVLCLSVLVCELP
jgi:hypothetical protein